MTTSIIQPFGIDLHHETNPVTTIRRHLKGVTVDEIQERVDAFLGRSTASMTDTEIRAAYDLIVHPGTSQSMSFTKSRVTVREGTNFYRGRKLLNPTDELKTTADVWAPRPEWVRNPGRLNSAGEPILYTSSEDPTTVIHECRIRVEDTFAISRFEAKNTFDSTLVGEDALPPGLTADEISKMEIIQRFLSQAFSANVKDTDPDPYRTSRLIALDYFDLPPQLFKGWAFRSVVDPGGIGWNFSFRPEVGRKSLRYKETHVYRLLGFDSDGRRPLTEFLAAIKPAKGEQLSWQSPEKFKSIDPFWP